MRHPARRRRRPTALVVLLAGLSLWDLRVELQLLLQHFTVTALGHAVLAHPLAVTVLALLPALQRWQPADPPGADQPRLDRLNSSGPSRP
ncbi:MAG: hypothetical protein VKM98_02820 [Cyanobacteriota bacterium]|nr:hypothetical protein [Cyanobacteriota bacterium]